MSNRITCSDCNETYRDNVDHICPGSAGERLDDLEMRADDFDTRLEKLEKLDASSASKFLGILEEERNALLRIIVPDGGLVPCEPGRNWLDALATVQRLIFKVRDLSRKESSSPSTDTWPFTAYGETIHLRSAEEASAAFRMIDKCKESRPVIDEDYIIGALDAAMAEPSKAPKLFAWLLSKGKTTPKAETLDVCGDAISIGDTVMVIDDSAAQPVGLRAKVHAIPERDFVEMRWNQHPTTGGANSWTVRSRYVRLVGKGGP